MNVSSVLVILAEILDLRDGDAIQTKTVVCLSSESTGC